MPPLQQDDGNTAATIGNPATAEFEVCRTSLLPGALKTLGAHVCVGLEGLCGQEPGVCPHMPPPCLPALPCLPAGAADPESQAVAAKLGGGYEWRADDAPTFFPGRHASVYFKGQRVGEFGIIHPEVLAAFDIVNPGGCHGRLGLGVAGRSAGVRAWLLFSSRPAG